MDSRQNTILSSQILKIVGIVMIVSSIIDYIILFTPPNFASRAWQITTTNQIVGQGMIPLLGLVLFFTGCWILESSGMAERREGIGKIKIGMVILSIILGLIFLLIVPLHGSNVMREKAEAFEQINQQIGQAENLKTQVEQRKKQLKEIVKDEKMLNATIGQMEEAIKKGQVPENQMAGIKNQLEILKKAKDNPKGFEELVDKQAQEFENQMQTKLRDDKLQAEKQTQEQAVKLGLKTGSSSLLLGIGYTAIGWLGLKNIIFPNMNRR